MALRRIYDTEEFALQEMIEGLRLDVFGKTKRERPDFELVLRDGRTLGVEVVRALDERLARARGTAARLAEMIRVGLAHANLAASVLFSLTQDTAAALHDQSQALREDVRRIISVIRESVASGRDMAFRRGADPLDAATNTLVERIGLVVKPIEGTAMDNLLMLSVFRSDTLTVSPMMMGGGRHGTDLVQAAIDSKVSRIQVYRSAGHDEQWLLVVGNAAFGQRLNFGSVVAATFTSPFDRTVFVDLADTGCAYLRTAA